MGTEILRPMIQSKDDKRPPNAEVETEAREAIHETPDFVLTCKFDSTTLHLSLELVDH